MVVHVKDLLSLYNLLDKLITYVKDEGGNLSIYAQALTLVVNRGPLGLVVPWKGSCVAMLLANYANMLVMILKFMLVLRRLV